MWLHYFIIWLLDIVRSFPHFILALAIVAVLGPSLFNVVVALADTAFPFYGRVARAQTLSVKEADYVKAAASMVFRSGNRFDTDGPTVYQNARFAQ
jgi:ABC-type dipeptide/oligopeptide/nickel transport system permease subunit